MSNSVLTTPVVFLVFNRPELTAQVFAAIREARPSKLLVVADGPRLGRSDDLERCAEVRRIVDQVDWACQVMHNYSEENLGCKVRVSSGLDWVFSQVEKAIILEDDCLPDQTFFRFCQEMLDCYRYDERVMSVCGSNPLGNWKADIQSYHFSLYGGIWGWATWRRAWSHYDVTMSSWSKPDIRRHIYSVLGGNRLYWQRALDFDRILASKIDTWDYQWSFAQLMCSGLTLVPARNQVSNIGFNSDATHTVDTKNPFASQPVYPCRFPVVCNHLISPDHDYDRMVMAKALSARPILLKVSDYIRYLFKKCFRL